MSISITNELNARTGKSARDLGREALWFMLHTLFAVAILAIVLGIITAVQPDPESAIPKVIATLLAFAVPLVLGFVIARIQKNEAAGYVWIAGVMLFLIVCVWVLDLPTASGLCEKCGALSKISRTFFEINHGSGLLGGHGVLIGTWIPLSIIGYSVGARLALKNAI